MDRNEFQAIIIHASGLYETAIVDGDGRSKITPVTQQSQLHLHIYALTTCSSNHEGM
jgi:hypothetical protein